MNIYMSQELEEYVLGKVKSGKYDSPSEVIRDSLELLKEQDLLRELRRKNIHREVMKGVEQIRNGEFTTISNEKEAEEFVEKIIRNGRKKRAKRMNE